MHLVDPVENASPIKDAGPTEKTGRMEDFFLMCIFTELFPVFIFADIDHFSMVKAGLVRNAGFIGDVGSIERIGLMENTDATGDAGLKGAGAAEEC